MSLGRRRGLFTLVGRKKSLLLLGQDGCFSKDGLFRLESALIPKRNSFDVARR
ncbi:hypothetical protein AGRO_4459 [Agrobacterium sp. ATCC 31749]|nr:hypothetical protein AGRO_4459 [Agrobacterium sp. ATCC 31749]